METTPHDEPALTTAHLPQPRGRARWRWSTPGRAAVAGGAMAVVLGLGAGVAGAASTPSSTSATNGSTASPKRPPQGARPTVAGRITAIVGTAVTVRTRDDGTTTVEYSADTTFTSLGAKGASTTASASALNVGAFIGVQGTTQSNGTVSASSIMLSTGPPPGGPGRPPVGGRGEPGLRPALHRVGDPAAGVQDHPGTAVVLGRPGVLGPLEPGVALVLGRVRARHDPVKSGGRRSAVARTPSPRSRPCRRERAAPRARGPWRPGPPPPNPGAGWPGWPAPPAGPRRPARRRSPARTPRNSSAPSGASRSHSPRASASVPPTRRPVRAGRPRLGGRPPPAASR